MKAVSRDQLKTLLKDIKEQLNSGIEVQDIYAKGFYYVGDNSFTNDDIIFNGRVAKKEMACNCEIDIESLESYRVLPTIQLIIDEEDRDITVSIDIKTIHNYCIYDGKYYIDILRVKY